MSRCRRATGLPSGTIRRSLQGWPKSSTVLAKIPAPPPLAKLVEIGADEKVIPSGMTFFRVYFRGSPHRVTWHSLRRYGPTDARFDHHLRPPREQERGILYLAAHPRTALAEVFHDGERSIPAAWNRGLSAWRRPLN